MFRFKHAAAGCLALLLLGCEGVPSHPGSGGPPVAVQVIVADVWPGDAVRRQLATAARRFAECGLRLTFVKNGEASAPRLLRFVPSIESFDGQSIEGRAFAFEQPQRAEIAWGSADGTPFEHKQTAAHELAHLFGLDHAPLHSINLMAPHGCELCRFTARQCDFLLSRFGDMP